MGVRCCVPVVFGVLYLDLLGFVQDDCVCVSFSFHDLDDDDGFVRMFV
mgnify:CR=1 FL=1